jgi:hypothetical protein
MDTLKRANSSRGWSLNSVFTGLTVSSEVDLAFPPLRGGISQSVPICVNFNFAPMNGGDRQPPVRRMRLVPSRSFSILY